MTSIKFEASDKVLTNFEDLGIGCFFFYGEGNGHLCLKIDTDDAIANTYDFIYGARCFCEKTDKVYYIDARTLTIENN